MGFTLPHTRLAFKHLRLLSCQRLGPHASLTTWISLLYMRLTNSLEFQDAILSSILILIIYTTHHHEISPRDSWNYAYLTTKIMFLIPFSSLLFHSSNSHVKTPPTHNSMIHLIPSVPISFIGF